MSLWLLNIAFSVLFFPLFRIEDEKTNKIFCFPISNCGIKFEKRK